MVGCILLLVTISAWLGLTAGVAAVHPWWLKFPIGLAAGVVSSLCFVVGHDACHGSLTRQAWLNKAIGRIAFLPNLHPFASWEHSHNGLHHGWPNVRGRDVVYVPFSKEEYDRLPWWRRRAERIFRTPFGPGLFYFFTVWIPQEMFPTAQHFPTGSRRHAFEWDRRVVLAFLAVWCLGLIALAQRWHTDIAITLLCGVLANFAMFNVMMGVVSFLHHTYPDVPWYDGPAEHDFYRSQIRSTVHLKLPRIAEIFLHDILQHTAHHADPRIPLYHLAESQACLEREFGADIVAEPWSWRGYLRVFRICRLFDYNEHRWVDYDGTPLTNSLLSVANLVREHAAGLP